MNSSKTFFVIRSLLNLKLIKLGMTGRPLSDYSSFRKELKLATNVVVLTGAGISAESGVPTFRGAGGFWRTFKAQNLATPEAFNRDASLVWEFYHYRREVVKTKQPNAAHLALADFEAKLSKEGRRVTVVTQNIDELHKRAGNEKLIELHGSLFKTLCTVCSHVSENYRSPICEALKDKGAPDEKAKAAKIPVSQLPRCEKENCGGLLRPYVVWFGENLDQDVLNEAQTLLEQCDFCIVVGTSAVVYPAAMFALQVARRGLPVAEFNIETTPDTQQFRYYFEGPCATTLPKALCENGD